MFHRRPITLGDHLPYALFLDDGVVMNKDGSYQVTARFRGPDQESLTAQELVSTRAQLNNALRALGSRWCIHIEARRCEVSRYPQGDFPDPVTGYLDQQRKKTFAQHGRCLENETFLTLLYKPHDQSTGLLEDLFVENSDRDTPGDGHKQYQFFRDQSHGVLAMLKNALVELVPLNTPQTLAYLHGCVSHEQTNVVEPQTPCYIDAYLADRSLVSGLETLLGQEFLGVVSLQGYRSQTIPGLLNGLNDLSIPYRWVVRYLPLDQQEAQAHIRSIQRKWHVKRKGLRGWLSEVFFQGESVSLENTAAIEKAHDADAALQTIADGAITFGFLSLTVVVWDPDRHQAHEKAREVKNVIDATGLVSRVESLNTLDGWLGTLPGNPYANVRRAMVSSLNVLDLMPLNCVWPGPKENTRLKAPVLMHTTTSSSTPFRFNLHQGDVPHTLIVGPTGSGKSTLLNCIAAQWRRYRDAGVYTFDKGASSKALTLAVGGDFYDLGSPDGVQELQPLSHIHQEWECAWAHEWLAGILQQENLTVTPSVKNTLWEALQNLKEKAPQQRTMSLLVSLVQDRNVKDALKPYTTQGPHGRLFDADQDHFQVNRWQTFELEHLLNQRGAVAPALAYLFHRLERQFQDGRPNLVVIDEFWGLLGAHYSQAKIRQWLKEMRKKNVALVFATQSLSDLLESPIASALIENCPTRVFLPNASALDPAIRPAYDAFKLNEQQVRLIATAVPKRQYYYHSPEGSRLFELALSDAELAFFGAGNAHDQRVIQQVLARHGKERFALHYLQAKGLTSEANELEPLFNNFPEGVHHESR